jgi:uncharacterized protein with HEPN domain
MTQHEVEQKILLSAFQSCIKIVRLRGEMTFDAFLQDEAIQDAIYWNLTVLGEALNRLSLEWVNNHREINVRNIVGLRNRIVHGYETIDPETIYIIITISVPELKDQLQEIL